MPALTDAPAARREPVTVLYAQLEDPGADLGAAVQQALGSSDSLGFLLVSGVPGFEACKARLLGLAGQLAQLMEGLSEEERAPLEDPASNYSFGWSRGKERLQDGRPDHFKGSFYANPLTDTPTGDPALMARHSTLLRPNIWPTALLPELEPAFKELGRLLLHVCQLLAAHLDAFVASQGCPPPGCQPSVAATLAQSRTPKGRLLHYFPQGSATPEGSDWCGLHFDHGSLTGLTGPLYTRGGKAGPCPDSRAGLYIRTRGGDEVQVRIPPGHLAIQVGQALEAQTGGLLKATEHRVRAAAGPGSEGVARSTFALFTQPNWDFPLGDGRLFGAMSEHTISGFYERG